MSNQTVYVEFVTGMMGTGKTSYIKWREQEGAKALYVGQICRAKFGSANMAKDSYAAAPESTEQFIRELVMQAIGQLNDGETLIVDGMPRKPSQVQWLVRELILGDHGGLKINCNVTYFTCEENTRRQRALERDKDNPGDNALREARMEQEPATFFRVLEEVAKFSHVLPMEVHDTSETIRPDTREKPEIENVEFVDTNICRMFESHKEFSDHVLRKHGFTMQELHDEAHGQDTLPQMHRSVQWARKFIEKAQGELAELMRELPDEWWTLDEVNIRKARVELIDAAHFMISGSMALGMMAPDFCKTFYGKQAVNWQRQQKGYIKKGKVEGDDAHVGGSVGGSYNPVKHEVLPPPDMIVSDAEDLEGGDPA